MRSCSCGAWSMSAEMLARAINYGRSRAFPTCLGNFFLPYNTPIDIPDARAARELQAFPLVHVVVVEGSLEPRLITAATLYGSFDPSPRGAGSPVRSS